MSEKVTLSKKKLTICICLFFVMTAFIASGISHLQKTETKDYAPTVSQQIAEKKYVLKLFNGKVAVFNDGSDSPIQITDISEHSLRNFDYEQLSLGVIVEGDVELAMRLEDYGS